MMKINKIRNVLKTIDNVYVLKYGFSSKPDYTSKKKFDFDKFMQDRMNQ